MHGYFDQFIKVKFLISKENATWFRILQINSKTKIIRHGILCSWKAIIACKVSRCKHWLFKLSSIANMQLLSNNFSLYFPCIISFFYNILKFLCGWFFSKYICMHHMHAMFMETEYGIIFPGTSIPACCELTYICVLQLTKFSARKTSASNHWTISAELKYHFISKAYILSTLAFPH